MKINQYAVMVKDFSYSYYAPSTIEAGRRLCIGRFGHLTHEGLVFTVGHGANEIIPRDHFRLEEEVVETVTRRSVRAL